MTVMTERLWKEEEISFLKSLTQNLTNAFEKREALEKVKKREEELKQSEQKFRATGAGRIRSYWYS